MSVIKTKSDDNYKSIELLSTAKLYTSGVHCAYYSSLQLIIHYFYEYTGINIETALSDISQNRSGGSHVYYANKLTEQLKKLNAKNASKFIVCFNKIKKQRVTADYSLDRKIYERDLELAYTRTKEIRKYLKDCENGKSNGTYNF